MFYLRSFCLFEYSSSILIWFCFSLSYVHFVAIFSELSIFDCPCGIVYYRFLIAPAVLSSVYLPLIFTIHKLKRNVIRKYMWSVKSWTFKAAIVKVLIKKWLLASLATDGSCLLYESGLAFFIHYSQQDILFWQREYKHKWSR